MSGSRARPPRPSLYIDRCSFIEIARLNGAAGAPGRGGRRSGGGRSAGAPRPAAVFISDDDATLLKILAPDLRGPAPLCAAGRPDPRVPRRARPAGHPRPPLTD